MSTGAPEKLALAMDYPPRARSLGSIALMGDDIIVGRNAAGDFTARPVTYRLPWTPPGWDSMERILWRHNTVEVDCVEFSPEGEPLEWAVTFLALRLTRDGKWERPAKGEDWPAFRERTQFCVPEVAVCHAYKYRDAKLSNTQISAPAAGCGTSLGSGGLDDAPQNIS